MSHWKLSHIKYLSGGSNISDNIGQIPVRAKYIKAFINMETFQKVEITDLQSKIFRRDKIISLFKCVYTIPFDDNKISLLAAVVNQKEYPTITKYLNTITRKLIRHNKIKVLGYIWCRDVGDLLFKEHFHVIIATTRIDADTFHSLFEKKTHNNYDIQFVKNINNLSGYINKKELYGSRKQRSFGKSRFFSLPKSPKTTMNHTK